MPRNVRHGSDELNRKLSSLSFFLVIDVLVITTILMSLSNDARSMYLHQAIPSPVIPVIIANSTSSQSNLTSQTPSSTPSLNVTAEIANGELNGRYGYWALANYTRHIEAFRISNSTYLLIMHLNGSWETFKGARSPNNGTTEPANASGTFTIGYSAIEPYSLNTSTKLIGYLGRFNLNGTADDIMRDNYSSQSGQAAGAFNWMDMYFGYSVSPNVTDNYTATYELGNQVYRVIFNSTGDHELGDIIT